MSGVTDHRQEAAQIPRATGWNRLQDRGATELRDAILACRDRPSTRISRLALAILFAVGVFSTALPAARSTSMSATKAQLRNAINDAASGDTVTFTLEHHADRQPADGAATNATINGGNFSLSAAAAASRADCDFGHVAINNLSASATRRRQGGNGSETAEAAAAAAAARDLGERCSLAAAPL